MPFILIFLSLTTDILLAIYLHHLENTSFTSLGKSSTLLAVLLQSMLQNVYSLSSSFSFFYVSPFFNIATVISAEHSTVDPEPREYHVEFDDGTSPKKYYFLVTTRLSDGSPVTHGGASLVSAIFPDSGGLFFFYYSWVRFTILILLKMKSSIALLRIITTEPTKSYSQSPLLERIFY